MGKFHVVEIEEIRKFMLACLKAAGINNESHSNDLVDVLIQADIRNHLSHGLNRLDLYIDDFLMKLCCDDCEPEVIKQNECTAWVDGKNVVGPRVGKFCMNLCIEKAKKNGIAIVSCFGSNHFGINQFYSLMAVEKGLIGMTFTNGSPLVASTFGKNPFLSTNPLCLAATGKENKFILDMATSSVAFGKLELQARKGEPIPSCWAIDKDGKSITDYKDFHALLPLGAESNYKGYGLGLMVELFTSLLSGSARAPNVRKWTDKKQISNIGHCFIAIDPNCFSPDFEDNLDHLATDARNQESANPDQPVLFPGDPELSRIKLIEDLKGIPYFESQIQYCNNLSTKFNIPKVKVLKEVDL